MNFSFDLPLDGLQRELAETALKRCGAPFDPADREKFHESVKQVWGYYRALVLHATPRDPVRKVTLAMDREVHRRDYEEFLDDGAYPSERRTKILKDLDWFNRIIRTYDWFFKALETFVADLPPGDLNVLDVGSGHGAFPIRLAQKGALGGRRVNVTGSDINPVFVEQAQALALKKKARVDFRVLDATRLAEDAERYDVIISSQTIHHFSPAFLAEIMMHLRMHARTGVALFDDRRAWWIAAAAAVGTGIVGRDYDFTHDAVVSVRRMYSAAELEMLAKCSPGGEAYRSHNFGPHYTFTTARTA